ncbi:MAG: molybdopterin oxidoreductase family protein [Janthinobacterium lividum]
MAEQKTRDSITEPWGPRTPFSEQWPARVDQHLTDQPEHWVQSACVLCANGCGLDIGVKDGRMAGVRGREADHVNRGRLGPKGLHGWMANESADRLKFPLIRRDGRLQRATWDEAMSLIASKHKELIREYTANTLGFYHSGQLFLEEYYTLSLITLAGLGTTHIDANTRLCTATAEAALRESFGTDGQPGCYSDIDTAETIFTIGHNIASQQTVLWMRILDRLAGANPPKLIVVDPRETATAKAATLHLAPRVGTNLALMNGLLHLVLRNGHIDREFVDAHTLGFEALEQVVAKYTPQRVAEVCGVPVRQLEQAAELLGSTPRLVSTVLQGVYQSQHATAAAVQVNNLHLLRGMIGKPGCTVFHMNGQPSAQNARECGAAGGFPAMRNWKNPEHVAQIAQLWNVHARDLPSYTEPTHAMEIFRRAEQGSVRALWVMCTNPAVSMPELARIRRILGKPGLFLVVQDAFLTETTQFADVVLPAAMWGEKTGTFTNTERTVHLSQKAVEPPGEAKADFDILLDYARRMDFRDKEGAPLVKWTNPEQAFDAWRAMSEGRPCDYSAMSYATLTGGSGVRWPCTQDFPEGRERLYTDGHFNTDPDYCQTFGHTLLSGSEQSELVYREQNPAGRALLKAADYEPAAVPLQSEYPFTLTSGRVLYHWHTRTKTGRVPALQRAAPDAFLQIDEGDAEALGIAEGEWVEARTHSGRAIARARLGGIRPGHVFLPFHYGYWDQSGRGRDRAANELTSPGWDPVSRQPYLKSAAAQIVRLGNPPEDKRMTDTAMTDTGMTDTARAVEIETKKHTADAVSSFQAATTPRTPGEHVGVYLALMQRDSQALAQAYEMVAKRHLDHTEVKMRCEQFAARNRLVPETMQMLTEHYGVGEESSSVTLQSALFAGLRLGPIGLLKDLHDLHTFVAHVGIDAFALKQAGSALKDRALFEIAERRMQELEIEEGWLNRELRALAPQALVVPS